MDKPNIEYAEGRVISFEDESAIQPSFLEIFTYTGPRQHVSYQMNEFAAVCPFSGLPDTGIVWVEYIPRQKLVELKALKYIFFLSAMSAFFKKRLPPGFSMTCIPCLSLKNC